MLPKYAISTASCTVKGLCCAFDIDGWQKASGIRYKSLAYFSVRRLKSTVWVAAIVPTNTDGRITIAISQIFLPCERGEVGVTKR